MKTKLKVSLIAIVCLNYVQLFSQEPCNVLKNNTLKKYEKKCKKELANGKELATCMDKYEGDLKNGLPDGIGKYTWSSGDVYEGGWKEGKRDGEGRYSFRKDGVDSVKTGIWKDDKFIKKMALTPYRIIRSMSVSRYTAQKIKNGSRVLFLFEQNGVYDTYVSNLRFTTTSGTNYSLGIKQGFDNVEFPFNCVVSYRTKNSYRVNPVDVSFEIEIKEPGCWEVHLTTN
ncbi:MAG: hypothetical protein HXX16_05765 [Bacteroidales bacterium]|nr:hypothetical protein [Bacteroidales bacterium]